MRHPAEVARQIASIVPSEHQSLFEHLAYSFSYKAPEQHHECWGSLGILCNSLLTDNTFEHDWQLEMISILTTKSKEELLAHQEEIAKLPPHPTRPDAKYAEAAARFEEQRARVEKKLRSKGATDARR